MEFSYREEGQSGIFSLKGTLIGEHDGMPLSEALHEQMETQGIIRFALDLTELKHINSTGIGVFITLLTRVRKKDGELVLINPSPNIRNLLLITKLSSIFKVYDSAADALAALNA